MVSIRMVVDPIQSIDAASIDMTYMGVGPRFDRSARSVFICNYTNAPLMFSWNGIDDHFPLPAFVAMLFTICNNDEETTEYFALPALSRLYVKEISAPTQGVVYITQFRGINDA